MNPWKLTKKLREFSSKPKTPSSTSPKDSDSLSITSAKTENSHISSSNEEHHHHNFFHHQKESSDTPSIVVSPSHVSRDSTIVKDAETPATAEDRRKTVTPNNCDELSPQLAKVGTATSHSSSKTVVSNQPSVQSTQSSAQQSQSTPQQNENLNSFKPGLMTVKIYNGENFKIPIDINFNKGLLTRLIACDSKPNEEDLLLKKLNNLNLDEEETRVINSDISSDLIPANISIPPSYNRNAFFYLTVEFDKTITAIDAEGGSIARPVFNNVSNFDVTKLKSQLKLQAFLRLPSILTLNENNNNNGEGRSSDDNNGNGTQNRNNQQHHNDILISSKTIDLTFDKFNNPIRIKNHEIIKFENEFSNYSKPFNGEIYISIDFKPSQNKHLTIDDFDLLKVIGKGSFGKVMQVRKKDSKKIYALKAIRKSHIVSRSEVTHTLAERTVLAKVDNPFIVPLKFSFQSPEKLYLVLSFINGGELFYHLQHEGKFDISRARFYTCELLSALECLHSLDVIYRDLKPENILLDYKGHIALCDFGLCKLNMKNQDKTTTFCGTPEYLAPELLLGHGYTKSVDWWTLGVLLYEMLTGLPPYYDEDVPTMYRKILTNPLKFPENFDKDAKDLLIKLLSRDPKTRLGNNGAQEIQKHSFFKMIDWRKLNNKGYLPPFKPNVKDSVDTSNFDQEFTNEKPVDSVMNDYLSESVQKQFGGWTYVGTEQLGDSVQKDV